MLFRKGSANSRDESFLINKTEIKIAIRAINSNTSFENVLRTSIKTNSHHIIITTKSLR